MIGSVSKLIFESANNVSTFKRISTGKCKQNDVKKSRNFGTSIRLNRKWMTTNYLMYLGLKHYLSKRSEMVNLGHFCSEQRFLCCLCY